MTRCSAALTLPCAALFLLMFSALTRGQPTLLYYNGFDDGKEDGVVGKAGPARGISLEARDKIDLDRGTLAVFVQSVKAPQPDEWGRLVGVNAMRGEGYWTMLLGFDLRLHDFVFNFYDVGRYCPPLYLKPAIGRWQDGQWHHLAAVWDRHEGITVYEDGQRVASNWGQHRWAWNFSPETLRISGPLDELYIFAQPLTDEQVAQLARGEKPTGQPIAESPLEKRRDTELARMGWSGDSVAEIPVVEAGRPMAFTFARFVDCTDSKRPIAMLFEGFAGTTWPDDMYGPSVRGKRLDIELEKGSTFDRVRLFTQRPYEGALYRIDESGREQLVTPIHTEQATIWHKRHHQMLSAERMALKREVGKAGQLDFYRVEAAKALPGGKDLLMFFLAPAQAWPTDTEAGLAVMAQTPVRDRQPVLATRENIAAWKLETPAFGGFQVFSAPLTEAGVLPGAFDGVLVTLVAEQLPGVTLARITVKEPVHGMRDWLIADAVLQPKGTGRQTFTILLKGRPVINLPTLQRRKYLRDGKYSDELETVPGAPLAVTVTTDHRVTWAMGGGGSTVALVKTDMNKALPAATADQLYFMREAYTQLMEGHAYSDKRLVLPMMWLAKYAPHEFHFRQMYERIGSPPWFVGIDVPKLVYEEPKNDTGAPDWAFWQRQAMNEHRRLLHWIIDHQQLPNGEYGGVWNDDTTHVENWMGHMLCMDDSGKIKDSFRLFLDGLWKHTEEGVCKYTQDIGHFAEDGMGSHASAMVVFYGDPTIVSRAMLAASHYDKWLVKDDAGKYVRRSFWVSVNGAWDVFGVKDFKNYGGQIMVPAGYVIWYNRHPLMLQYQRGWPGGGDGLDDISIDIANGKPRAELDQWYEQQACQPVGRAGVSGHLSWIDQVGVTEKIKAAHAPGITYKPAGPIAHYWGSKDTDQHYFNWKITGDDRFLVDSYKRVCEWFYSHDWLNTEARPSMDRNPLPRGSLIRARIGSLAGQRTTSGPRWPLYAYSFDAGADDVASLVTENLDTQIAARLYPLTNTPHHVRLRLWRLKPGKYRVTVAHDQNNDNQPEGVYFDQEMTFDRGAYLDLTLPPRQTSLLTITALDVTEPNFDRPDPAIGPDTCELVYSEHLVVHVYNLGTQPAKNVLVRVRDGRSGQVVLNGQQRIPVIEAPLDMKPRHVGVEFKNINANTYGHIIIEVDPDREIDDLNPYNNRVDLKY